MIIDLKVLIVDDHHIIVESYKNILESYFSDKKVILETACNCDSALSKIEKSNFDILLLDINIPCSKENKKIISGQELGICIKNKNPDIKIIVISSHNDNYRVNSILKNLNPNGFLVKSEIKSKDLINCLDAIIEDNTIAFYSDSINRLVRKQISTKIVIDNFDIQILKEISNGTKNSELPNYLPLSKATIDKRKQKLKDVFNVLSGSDRELISTAKQNGFI